MQSILDILADYLSYKEPVPNKFTIAVGKLVREARLESGLSQADLAKLIHRRRATISDIETGISEVGITTLSLISVALDKPITYFLTINVRARLKPDDLEIEEKELLMLFHKISNPKLREIAIRQAKLLADFDIEDFQEALTEHFEDNPSET